MTIHPAAAETDWSLHEEWLTADESRHWQARLEQQLLWQQPVIHVFGKRHPVPRMTAFLADQGLQYRYSGAIHTGCGWPEWFHPY